MEECESTCERIAIIDDGQFRCFGSPDSIRTKFGKGYTVKIKFEYKKRIDKEKMLESVMTEFPGMQIVEYTEVREKTLCVLFMASRLLKWGIIGREDTISH